MVSLENSRNAKGGFSFGPTPTPINDEFAETISQFNNNNNANSDTLPLTTEIEPNFKQIGTTYMIILQIVTVILLILSAFLIPHFCGENDEKCAVFNGFSLIVIIHGGMWVLKFIFDRFYHRQHMKSRRHGYLTFYRVTRLIRSIPLIVVSASNSILVILLKIIEKYCPKKCTTFDLKPENLLQVFVCIECAILLPVLFYYLVVTINFNRSKKSPDISIELNKPTAFNGGSELKDVGFKDSSFLSNTLENQADMIRYLQERNEKLSQKIFQLTQKTATSQNIN